MSLDATQPTTLNATYDKWAVAGLMQIGDGCVGLGELTPEPIQLQVRLVKYRVRDDGKPERSPYPTDVRVVTIADLYAEAATNPDIAAVVQALTAAVASYAASRNLL